jgi:hypothetical protein
LPIDAENNEPIIQPLAVLDWKKGTGPADTQVLIQWEDLFPEDATWECYEEIQATYPDFNLEDKVDFDEIWDVMSKETTSEDGATTTPKLRAKRHTTRPKYLEDFAEVGIAPRRGKK